MVQQSVTYRKNYQRSDNLIWKFREEMVPMESTLLYSNDDNGTASLKA